MVYARRDFHIRVLGTHVTLQEELRKRAESDLGIRISFEPGGSAAVLHQASTRPESFDLYEQWSNSLQVLWQAGAIQAIALPFMLLARREKAPSDPLVEEPEPV